MAFHGCDEGRFLDGMGEYADYMHKIDVGVRFTKAHPRARFFDARKFLGDADFFDDPYVRWNKDRLGSSHWQTAYTLPEDGLTFGLALHGTQDRGPLSDEQTGLYKMLFEHMERAMRLTARPTSIVDDKAAVILVDRTGRVREMSDPAQEIVAQSDGLFVDSRRLRTSARSDQAALDVALRSALSALESGGAGGAVKLSRPSGRRDLLVKVSPLPSPPPPFDAIRPAAMVRILVPENAPAGDPQALLRLYFGLTVAEARLATALLQGTGNLRAVAGRLGIAYSTARVQLSSVFSKTGVQTQAQLIRTLLSVIKDPQ